MGKTIVIYKSKYGSTAQYAKWIAQALDCAAVDSITPAALGEYDTILFGGGLYAGSISGISVITENWKALRDKHVIVFTVGFSAPDSREHLDPILERNLNEEQRERIKVFHLRGCLDYKKLGPVHKVMMAAMAGVLKKKKELTEDDRMLLDTYGGKADFMDRTTIEPVVACVKGWQ